MAFDAADRQAIETELTSEGIPTSLWDSVFTAIDAAGFDVVPQGGGAAAAVVDAVTATRRRVSGMSGVYLVGIEGPAGETIYALEERVNGVTRLTALAGAAVLGYATMQAASGQSSFADDDRVAWDTPVGTLGVSLATDQITLAPGKYKIDAVIRFDMSGSTTKLAIYNETAAAEIGQRAQGVPANAAVNRVPQVQAHAYLDATVETAISLRVVNNASNLVAIQEEGTWLEILRVG